MSRTEILQEIEAALNEVMRLINNSYEHNDFNSSFFEPKFKKWFAKKMDNLEARYRIS